MIVFKDEKMVFTVHPALSLTGADFSGLPYKCSMDLYAVYQLQQGFAGICCTIPIISATYFALPFFTVGCYCFPAFTGVKTGFVLLSFYSCFTQLRKIPNKG